MVDAEFQKYLNKVRQTFNIQELVSREIDGQSIVKYYEQSELGYRIFHSFDGSIHMALNYDGKFDKEGYYGQAKIVHEQVNTLNAKRVLELASGKGFNSIYLARHNPRTHFVGIDLTPNHVSEAKKSASELMNLEFERGDFQALSFEASSFDLVFVVESICHATNMHR